MDSFLRTQNTKDFSDNIDKACAESVNDLLATIAKLDSNGVQVLPEGRGKTTSPQVHSSTDLSIVSTGGGGERESIFFVVFIRTRVLILLFSAQPTRTARRTIRTRTGAPSVWTAAS